MNAGSGSKAEPLPDATRAALGGRTAALEDLFKRHGGGPDPRPNLKLAAAFGDEMAGLDGDDVAPVRLLARLAGDDAAPDTFEVFLPMAAAFGWVGRLRARRDVEAAWAALRELAGDERPPVRVATHAALLAYALAREGATELVTHASSWLDGDEGDDRAAREAREVLFGAMAVVLEVLGDRPALAIVRPLQLAFDFLERTLDVAANAPRSSERSDGRRRLLAALPRTLATVATVGGDAGIEWLDRACADARQPNVRAALSDAVVRVQRANTVVGQRVRQSLAASAKPPRDPTRRRQGVGRGKASREQK